MFSNTGDLIHALVAREAVAGQLAEAQARVLLEGKGLRAAAHLDGADLGALLARDGDAREQRALERGAVACAATLLFVYVGMEVGFGGALAALATVALATALVAVALATALATAALATDALATAPTAALATAPLATAPLAAAPLVTAPLATDALDCARERAARDRSRQGSVISTSYELFSYLGREHATWHCYLVVDAEVMRREGERKFPRGKRT